MMRLIMVCFCLFLMLAARADQPRLMNHDSYILNRGDVWWVFGGSSDWKLSGNPAESWSFQHLKVCQGASLHLEADKSLDISGILDNQNGADGIVLHADENLRASLIHHSPAALATVHSLISAVDDWHAVPATDWRMLSSPVEGQAIEGFIPEAGDGDYDFYAWSESDQMWINHKEGETFEAFNQGLDFRPGHGYLVAYEQDQHFVFRGVVNAGDVVCNGLGHSEDEQYGGWHMLGNPYAAALEWNHEAWEREGVYDEVHVWDPPSGNYISNNQGVGDFDGIIRSQQAMFIKAKPGTRDQSLSIPAGARIHLNDNAHRNRKELPVNTMRLAVTSPNLPYSDATFIRMLPDAKTSFDPRCDAHKLFGSPKAPLLHTKKGNQALSIYGLKAPEDREEILLWFHPGTDNEYLVAFQGTGTMDSAYRITFTDLHTQTITNLREEATYHFQDASDAPLQRFILTFCKGENEALGTGEEALADQVVVYAYQDWIYIHLPGNEYGQARLMDPQGRLIRLLDLPHPGEHRFRMELAPGPYLVDVITNQGRSVQKVMLSTP